MKQRGRPRTDKGLHIAADVAAHLIVDRDRAGREI